MSLSRADSELVMHRSTLLSDSEEAVAAAMFDALWSTAASMGVHTNKCDECAKMEAAIIRYLVASRADAPLTDIEHAAGLNEAALRCARAFGDAIGRLGGLEPAQPQGPGEADDSGMHPHCRHQWNQTPAEADENHGRIYCLVCGDDGDA